jgi:hypothetical protein
MASIIPKGSPDLEAEEATDCSDTCSDVLNVSTAETCSFDCVFPISPVVPAAKPCRELASCAGIASSGSAIRSNGCAINPLV